MCNMLLRGYSSWSYWSPQVKLGRNERGLSTAFLCAQPWRSPCTTCSPVHQSPVLNLLLRCALSLFGAQWSIKTIFLMFVLFTPVLDHPWMSTLQRMVAPGRIILFQRQTVFPFKSSPRPLWCMHYAHFILHDIQSHFESTSVHF